MKYTTISLHDTQALDMSITTTTTIIPTSSMTISNLNHTLLQYLLHCCSFHESSLFCYLTWRICTSCWLVEFWVVALIFSCRHPFTPTKLCAAVEEAKVHAAEHTLQTLGLLTEGAGDAGCATAPAVAPVAFPGM